MPPDTRSRGQPPPSRVYHSTPALQQVQFPSRRRIIRTYGRRQSAPPLRQQTLTQIDYLVPRAPVNVENDDTMPSRDRKRRRRTVGGDRDGAPGAVDEDDGEEDQTPASSRFQTQTLTQLMDKRSEARKRSCSRPVPHDAEIISIKDSEDEDDEDDEDSVEEGEEEDDEEDEEEDEEKDEEGGDDGEGEEHREGEEHGEDEEGFEENYGNDENTETNATARADQVKAAESRLATPSPRTPSHKSIIREIPSSQPSLGTPLLSRLSPLGPLRSPLKHKSPNVMISLPKPLDLDDPDRKSNIPKLTALDSSTVGSVDTPSKRRWVEDDVHLTSSAKRHKKVSFEIPDSDDEEDERGSEGSDGFEPIADDEDLDEYRGAEDPGAEICDIEDEISPDAAGDDDLLASNVDNLEDGDPQDAAGDDDVMATHVDNLDDGDLQDAILDRCTDRQESGENQAAREKRVADEALAVDNGGEGLEKTKTDDMKVDDVATLGAKPHKREEKTGLYGGKISNRKKGRPAKTDTHVDFETGAETQMLMNQLLTATERRLSRGPSSTAPSSSTQGVSQNDTSCIRPIRRPKVVAPAGTQLYESQRVPLKVIRSMPPTSTGSDVFISIHPRHVADIVAGRKNHEFRKYHIPETVYRFWIYETRPVSQVRYMALVSPGKAVGQIEHEERGIGNAEFNRGEKQSRWAYELLEVYMLNNPVPLAEMIEEGWLKAAPQSFKYVPPAVVGQLLGNLRESVLEETVVQEQQEGEEDDEEKEGDEEDEEDEENQAARLTGDGSDDETSSPLDLSTAGLSEMVAEVLHKAEAKKAQVTSNVVLASPKRSRRQEEGKKTGNVVISSSQDYFFSCSVSRAHKTVPATLPTVPASSPDAIFKRPPLPPGHAGLPAAARKEDARMVPSSTKYVAGTADPHTPPRGMPSLSQVSTASRASSTPRSPRSVSPSPAPRMRRSTPRPAVSRPAVPHSSSEILPSLLLESSGGAEAVVPNSTPMRALAVSSQAMSGSQALPESLMVDDGREPPDVIWDSQAEEEDED